MRAIQGDSGGNVSNLGSDSIDHSETEILRMNMRLILNGYRDRAVRIYKYKNIMNSKKKRKKLLTGNLILNLI
jgi:hypothetical protein